jgi:HK97 family phage major capsid protein
VTTYSDIISRDASLDPLVPTPVSAQIIQELPAASVMLTRAQRTTMSANTQRQPVLDVLPLAYFVGGDTGLKQTTSQDWKNVDLVVEEAAVIVPIPEAYLDDAQMPIWDQVRPRMVEAIGRLVDGACLFGTNKPSTWSTDLYTGAIAAGNAVIAGTGDDYVQDVTGVAEKLSLDGYGIDGFICRPGLPWKFAGLRTGGDVQIPIFQPDATGKPGGMLFGYPMSEVKNGAWHSRDAELIMGDWSKAIVGMRQDLTFKMFTEGVISDSDGKVILNLMQQDSVAMRVVIRLAFATANPATQLNTDSATRYPFAVLQAGTAAS